MGIWDRFKRSRAEQADAERDRPVVVIRTEVTRTSPPRPTGPESPRSAIKRVARALAPRYPDGAPDDVLAEVCEAENVDPDDVRRQIKLDAMPYEPLVVTPRRVDVNSLRVMDLTELESVRLRIKGSACTVSDTERRRQGGPEYLLLREPDNESDASAVAVYGVKGRRVGWVSSSRAAMLSPLIAQLDADAFRVTGTGTNSQSIVMSVDLPKADALRRFVREARSP